MGTTMGPRRALCALALNAFLCLCIASPSVPIATDPILSTETVPTVIPSLVTIYTIVPATDATPGTPTTITTTIDGQTTTIISTGVVAGSITDTIISTISLTTNQEVVNTIGYSTILGPDPTTPTTEASLPPTTAVSTSDTPTPAPISTSAPDVSTTSSTIGETNALATSSATSTTLSSTASLTSSPSSSTTGANASTQAAHSSSTSKGLSTGAKAGIGAGVAVGVILLVLLSFLLGQRYSRRRNERAKDNTDLNGAGEKDIFQAGRPYEATGPRHDALAPSAAKGHAYSTNTTAIGSGSESTSGRSYDMPISNSANDHANNPELSALPPIEKGDEPMYVGVPAHMSGSKRWSMKEFMK